MYTITKEFCFEAAHQLVGVPVGHPCGNIHGHSYRIQVVLRSGALVEPGWIEDYRNLDDVKKLVALMDHSNLNDLFLKEKENQPELFKLRTTETTAENLAWWLYQKIKPAHPLLDSVRVSETQKTWAEYKQ